MSISDSDAGELIPELVRQGMQALIEPESTAAIGVDRHRCTPAPPPAERQWRLAFLLSLPPALLCSAFLAAPAV